MSLQGGMSIRCDIYDRQNRTFDCPESLIRATDSRMSLKYPPPLMSILIRQTRLVVAIVRPPDSD